MDEGAREEHDPRRVWEVVVKYSNGQSEEIKWTATELATAKEIAFSEERGGNKYSDSGNDSSDSDGSYECDGDSSNKSDDSESGDRYSGRQP